MRQERIVSSEDDSRSSFVANKSGRRRGRTRGCSYIPRNSTSEGKEQSLSRKSSVNASLFNFLDDHNVKNDTINSLKEELVVQLAPAATTMASKDGKRSTPTIKNKKKKPTDEMKKRKGRNKSEVVPISLSSRSSYSKVTLLNSNNNKEPAPKSPNPKHKKKTRRGSTKDSSAAAAEAKLKPLHEVGTPKPSDAKKQRAKTVRRKQLDISPHKREHNSIRPGVHKPNTTVSSFEQELVHKVEQKKKHVTREKIAGLSFLERQRNRGKKETDEPAPPRKKGSRQAKNKLKKENNEDTETLTQDTMKKSLKGPTAMFVKQRGSRAPEETTIDVFEKQRGGALIPRLPSGVAGSIEEKTNPASSDERTQEPTSPPREERRRAAREELAEISFTLERRRSSSRSVEFRGILKEVEDAEAAKKMQEETPSKGKKPRKESIDLPSPAAIQPGKDEASVKDTNDDIPLGDALKTLAQRHHDSPSVLSSHASPKSQRILELVEASMHSFREEEEANQNIADPLKTPLLFQGGTSSNTGDSIDLSAAVKQEDSSKLERRRSDHTATTALSTPMASEKGSTHHGQPLSAKLTSSTLCPKTDLAGFIRHLAVLNELKDLIDAPTQHGTELILPFTDERSSSHWRRSRFQQMFQVKCVLLNILLDSKEDPSAVPKKQGLLQQYDCDSDDLEFILEHIQLCQEEYTEIRWDLVETMIFPDYVSANRRNGSQQKQQPITGSGSGQASYGANNFYPLGASYGASIAGDSIYWSNSTADFSVDPGRSGVAESTMHHEDESLSRREEYQEVVLDVYEAVENALAQLSLDECQLRRQVLVQLLQATSEDEAHLTNLALDDIAEIVHHFRICMETDTPVQWDMVRDIVFPLGIGTEVNPENKDSEIPEEAPSTLHGGYERFVWSPDSDEGWALINDLGNHEQADDSFRDFFELAPNELDVVLNHINTCKDTEEPIRWDLISEVLFPGDPVRQTMLSKSYSGAIYDEILEVDPGLKCPSNHFLEDTTKQRKRALLSLSNHDLRLSSHHGAASTEGDYDSDEYSFRGDYMEDLR